MPTKAVTDASFAADVLESDKPVLVDFWADWCGPCKMIGPALEEISDELADKVTIAKMDIMENTQVPGQIGVQSIPLMVLFKDGKAVKATMNWGALEAPLLAKGALWTATAADNSTNILGGTMVDDINDFIGKKCLEVKEEWQGK